MSSIASGAAPTRAFNPSTDTHYAISEETQHSLQCLTDALIGLAQLGEVPDDELGPYIEVRYLAALFRVLSEHGQNLMATAITRFPAQEARAKARRAAAKAAPAAPLQGDAP